MIEVGRAIDGISINGLEWLLDDEGQTLKFESRNEAMSFLRDNGFDDLSDEDLEDSFYFRDTEDS